MLKKEFNNFIKRFLLLLVILSTVSIFVNAGTYNSSWENLVLDSNGWCANIEIPFRVYTESNFTNKDDILDDLCGEDETPEDDNCEEFEIVEAEVKIYDGPMDGLDVLYEGKLDDNDEFKFTFHNANQYLIEITPTEGEFNDLTKLIEVIDCKIPTSETNKIEKYNLTFNYLENSVTLDLININSKNDSSIVVNDLTNSWGANKKNNTEKILQIAKSSTEINYNEATISLDISDLPEPDNLTLFEYEPTNKKWNEKNNYKIENNKIIFSTDKFGIYGLVNTKKEESKISDEIIDEKSKNESLDNNTKDLNSANLEKNKSTTTKIEENSPKEENMENNINDTNNSNIILLIIVGISVIGGILFGMMLLKNKKKSLPPPKKVEVISDKDLIYKKTKEYVQKYKNEYSRDKIYRMLKKTDVPKDIIDKVYLEEFN